MSRQKEGLDTASEQMVYYFVERRADMRFSDYLKSKIPALLLNGAALFVLCVFLRLLGNSGTVVLLIAVVWVFVLGIYLLAEYYFRRKYFQELLSVLEELDQKYLVAEVIKPADRLEDKLYWEVLRRSNRSVIEKIHELEDSQKEYKEFIESWIHEIKMPLTAAQLICENHKGDETRRILLELDEIENEAEKILYYVRMGQVYQDYLIRPVNLREVALAAIRAEKRHFIQCGMQIDLDMEDITVSTDEKWAEFILKQIFSNSMKYRGDGKPGLKIYVEDGRKQKSLVVEDYGRGICKEDLPRIFDKGFTGENGRTENNRATGIGLYLCKRLCEKIGAGIACESEKGKYTRMILTFPDSDYNKIGEAYKNVRLS